MIRFRTMTLGDLDLGMRLKAAAGWNQTLGDWRRFLDLGAEGCFVAEVDARGVGTVTTCVFGTVAWIAMVLVDPVARGQGVGTALMSHALAHLDRTGVPTVRLDATPLGRPIYEKLGFTIDYDLARYDGVVKPPQPQTGQAPGADTHPGAETILPPGTTLPRELHALSAAVTGTDYRRLLARLHADHPDATRLCRREGAITGFAMSRPGVNAAQVGPCVATTPDAGTALLDDAARRLAGHRVFIDIPLDNQPAVAWATAAGLKVQRPFYRMTRGPHINDHPRQVWATSGPEMG